MGLSKDADIVVEGEPFQCKCRDSLAEYLKPSDDVAGVVIREGYKKKEHYVVLRYPHYLHLRRQLKELRRLLRERHEKEVEG